MAGKRFRGRENSFTVIARRSSHVIGRIMPPGCLSPGEMSVCRGEDGRANLFGLDRKIFGAGPIAPGGAICRGEIHPPGTSMSGRIFSEWAASSGPAETPSQQFAVGRIPFSIGQRGRVELSVSSSSPGGETRAAEAFGPPSPLDYFVYILNIEIWR